MTKTEEHTEGFEASSERLESSTNLLTTVLGLVTGSASIIYVFGYIIVNLRLLQHGVRDFSLGNPTYLSAGILFIVFHVLVVLFPSLVGLIIDRNPRINQRQKSIWGNVMPWILSILLPVGILVWIGNPDITSLTIYGFLIFFLSVGVRPLFLILNKPLGVLRAPLATFGIVYIISATVFLVMPIWSGSIYPYIDASYGGGSPVYIQFVVGDDVQTGLFEQTGINFVSQNRTEILELIDDNGSSYVVKLRNGQVARVSRELVANILYWSPFQLQQREFYFLDDPAIITPTETSVPESTPKP